MNIKELLETIPQNVYVTFYKDDADDVAIQHISTSCSSDYDCSGRSLEEVLELCKAITLVDNWHWGG